MEQENKHSGQQSLEAYLAAFYAPSTVKEYGRDIENYLSNCPEAEGVMYRDIVAYIGKLRERYSNGATLGKMVSAIKAYYGYLCHEGIREDNPARGIRLMDRVSKDRQLQDLFTEVELEAMLDRKEPYKKNIYRNGVLMSLLIYQGLWPQEVAGLRVVDIDLKAATVRIGATPKSAGRTLELKASQVLLFYEYIHQVRPGMIKAGTDTDRLLIGLQGRALPPWAIGVHIKRCYGGMYPGRKVSTATIRQSVIANLLKAGNDVSVVQLFAGHLCAASTQRYEQGAVNSLAAAVQQYHPLQ
jgi:integrase/recombinase XerD